MERFDKWFPLAYSPLFTGFVAGWWGLIALGSMLVVSPAAAWVWLVILAGSAIGALLQYTTRRVLVIRVYDLVMYSLTAVTGAVLTWDVLLLAWGESSAVFAGVLIAAMLVSFGAITYIRDRRNPKRVRLPCATIGKMDPKTGLIVDPRYMDKTLEDTQQGGAALRTILGLTPLIAGLSIMVVRGLPDDVAVLLFLLPGVFIAVFMTWMLAKSTSFLVGTIRWERAHGKRIYVKR